MKDWAQSIDLGARPHFGHRQSLCLLLALVLGGCHGQPPPTARGVSVVLITVDALRPDRLSCYGYSKQQTPGIDRLASEGALFERAVCDVPWTTGSMASVFTGQYASQHHLRMSTERLSDSAVTLAEVLHEHGYRTGAVVGSFPLASIYNLNQGFDDYDEDFTTPLEPLASGAVPVDMDGKPRKIKKVKPLLQGSPEQMQQYFAAKAANDACRPDREVSDRAIAWLTRHASESFFLWVHYFGPHERMNLFETWEQQSPRVIADYDRDLAVTDAQVGRLLDAIDQLGLRDHTLVVLHADHGQSLGENHYVGHGDNLYPATLRIPLLMRWPGRIRAGQQIGPLAQNVDLFPTILGLLGVRAELPFSGLDLSDRLTSPDGAAAPSEPRMAYAETFLSTFEVHRVETPQYGALSVRLERFGLLRDNRMYLRNEFVPPCTRGDGAILPDDDCRQLWTEEVFDPFADPQAARSLIDSEAGALPAWRAQLATYRDAARGRSEPVELSPGQKEKLRALGYDR